MDSGQLPVQAHSAAARCSALKNAIKDEVAFAHSSNDHSSHRLRIRAPDGGARRSCTWRRQPKTRFIRSHSRAFEWAILPRALWSAIAKTRFLRVAASTRSQPGGGAAAASFTLPSSRTIVVASDPGNHQRIVDPLTAMLFSAAAGGEGLSQEACRHTLPIFDGNHRYDLKLAF